MILNARMVMAPPKNKKPSSTGTRGLLSWYHPTLPSSRENSLFESAACRLKTPARSRGPPGSAYCPSVPPALAGKVGVRPAAPRPFSAVPWTLLLSFRRFSVVPAAAYSPSSTPLRMNLLAGTIRVMVPGCQAGSAIKRRPRSRPPAGRNRSRGRRRVSRLPP